MNKLKRRDRTLLIRSNLSFVVCSKVALNDIVTRFVQNDANKNMYEFCVSLTVSAPVIQMPRSRSTWNPSLYNTTLDNFPTRHLNRLKSLGDDTLNVGTTFWIAYQSIHIR